MPFHLLQCCSHFVHPDISGSQSVINDYSECDQAGDSFIILTWWWEMSLPGRRFALKRISFVFSWLIVTLFFVALSWICSILSWLVFALQAGTITYMSPAYFIILFSLCSGSLSAADIKNAAGYNIEPCITLACMLANDYVSPAYLVQRICSSKCP